MPRWIARTVLGLAVTAVAAAPASAAPRCRAAHWVASWAASPSDATPAPDLGDPVEVLGSLVDVSVHPKLPVAESTVRDIVTPHWGGTSVRVHLSNRFGTTPVTFGRVTIARQVSGARVVPSSITALSFGGQRSVTVAPGADVISDPAQFSFAAQQHLAVSIYVSGAPGHPTEHYTARQTSFTGLAGSGDQTGEAAGALLTQPMTSWLYLSGIDVRAPGRVGTVVAFGDSITDGYQGEPTAVPETKEGIDADGRWPDVLARRLLAAGRRLSVVNAGISGNRILVDGAPGGGIPQYGPSGLSRLDADVIRQAGVTDVIVLEGINDLGTAPAATANGVIEGLRTYVRRLHKAHIRVLVGTLTPASRAGKGEAARLAVNAWVRDSGVPDAVVDFDKAVRDPAQPSRILPAYDGSDHLHFSLAGYRAMGAAVPLRKLRDRPCSSSG